MQLGFRRGVACPTCFWHETRQISIVVHGDDFVALGRSADLDWYEKEMEKRFESGDRSILGRDKNDSQEARILNRVVRLTEDGVRFEADPRHVELLARALGLQGCSEASSATPGVKQSGDDIDDTYDTEINTTDNTNATHENSDMNESHDDATLVNAVINKKRATFSKHLTTIHNQTLRCSTYFASFSICGDLAGWASTIPSCSC